MLIEELLELATYKKASDLHISAGLPPVIRVDGRLIRVDQQVLSPDDVESLVFPMLSNEQRRRLEQEWELDFSYGVQGLSRFRVNIYKDKGSYAAAFRTINSVAPSFDTLGLPDIVKKVSDRPRGLVLVTGPTGSGKSTTLATMIDYINSTRAEHILTIEDPIEFVHKSKKSIIHQRELGQDTRSFSNALRSALREDPDVILVGEMRDLETIRLAITAAETGHLVFGTLHTSSASQTIDRIVDVFPEGQQQQIRIQLSTVCEGIISQQLVTTKDNKGRIAATEVMVVTPAIRNLIRENKTFQIQNTIQTSSNKGMHTMDQDLINLYNKGKISREIVLNRCSDYNYINKYIEYMHF